MLRVGHYGVALAVYAPVGAALALAGFRELAVTGGVVVVALTMLPDVDVTLPLVPHRGPTHTLAFALVVGFGVATAAGELLAGVVDVPAATARNVGLAAGTLAVGAHLLADALTPEGVPLLWPLSDRRLSLSLWTAGNALANWLLLGVGVAATVAAVAAVQGPPLP